MAELCAILEQELPTESVQHLIRTFKEDPTFFILDQKMWLGIDCPYCRNEPPPQNHPICRHVRNLRKRQYQNHMLVEAIKGGFAHLPGIARSLGMTRREVEEGIEYYERTTDQSQLTELPARSLNAHGILTLESWKENSSSDDSSDFSNDRPARTDQTSRGRTYYTRRDTPSGQMRLPGCSNCDRIIDTDNLPVKCGRCQIEKMCTGCGINTHDAQTWAGEPESYPACQSCRRKHRKRAEHAREVQDRVTRMRQHYGSSSSSNQP